MEKVIDYKALYEASLQKNAVLVEQNNSLYKENSSLLNKNSSLQSENGSLLAKQEELLHSLDSLRRQLFGMKSDKQVKHAIAGQLELFNLAAPDTLVEQIGEELKEEIKEQQAKNKKNVRQPKRMVLPEHLERKEVIIDPQGDLSGYKIIGSDSCEVLVIDPMKMWVKRIIRRKWALIDSQDINRPGIKEAPAPSRTVKGGLFDESVLSFLLVNKYSYHLPLYRMKQMFAREGIPISASTLSDNVVAAITTLEPIYRALKKEVLGSKYLQSDETTYKVLRSEKKGACHNGYMWAFHSPPSGLLFFQYCMSRAHTHPAEILKNFRGVLQTDAYPAYGTVIKGADNPIKHLFCMAHIRRNFDLAASNDLPRAKIALDFIASMYAVEKKIRESQPAMDEDKIVLLRIDQVKPILDNMKEWMIREYPSVLPKSPIGKALSYALKLWDNMSNYLLHGDLELDNNKIENEMRPIALNRKNSLFSGTHKTAQDAAMIFSLFATCRKHGVDTQKWLTDVFYKINDPEFEGRYSDLMPHRWKNNS